MKFYFRMFRPGDFSSELQKSYLDTDPKERRLFFEKLVPCITSNC